MWRRLAVISGLAALAVVAPLLDIYGKNPEVFVANRTSTLEIVLFAVGVGLLVPLLSWAVLAVAQAVGGRAPGVTYLTLVVVLALGAGLVVSRQVQPHNTLLAVVVAVATSALIIWLTRNLEILFVIAAVAIPVTMIMFLATSATARLIWEEPEVAQDGVEVGNPAHVVLIQLDEMPLASIMEPDLTVNEDLFPGFARLAEEGTWYRNALSDSIATTQSVPAILTGAKVEEGESPSYVDHPDNLFTLLGGTYEMHVIEWIAELCPEDVCPDYAGRSPARFSSLLKDVGVVYGHLTLPGTTREELPSIDNAWRGFLGQEETPEGATVEIEGLPVPEGGDRQEWIDWIQRLTNGIAADAPPTLSYAHLPAPHVPWMANPSGTHYQRPEEYTEVSGVEGDGRWGPDPSLALLGFQRHLYQVGLLDQMLNRLLDQIDRTGTWDDTMIIVLADHGASFVPGEHRRWPYQDNRDDLYRVPMFIKYPGQNTGEVVDLPAFGVDLVPTIVDTLDVETDWEFDGISLLGLDEDRPHQPTHWCCSAEGASTDLEVLRAQVERNHRWIPDQRSWPGVAAVGDFASLVGRPTTEIEQRDDDTFSWSLDLGKSLDEVDRSSGFVQTLVTGRVEADRLPESDELLVVVNDVVAGVAHLSRDSVSGGSIIGLISEELVRDGANDVGLLMPAGDGAWLSGERRELTFDLVTDEGRILELGTEGSRRIQIDSVEATDDGWQVEGWAADVTDKETPDQIYVFAGDELIVSGPPNEDNSNVVRWFESEDLLRSGFLFEIGADAIPGEIDRILVVAEFGDGAVADPATLNR